MRGGRGVRVVVVLLLPRGPARGHGGDGRGRVHWLHLQGPASRASRASRAGAMGSPRSARSRQRASRPKGGPSFHRGSCCSSPEESEGMALDGPSRSAGSCWSACKTPSDITRLTCCRRPRHFAALPFFALGRWAIVPLCRLRLRRLAMTAAQLSRRPHSPIAPSPQRPPVQCMVGLPATRKPVAAPHPLLSYNCTNFVLSPTHRRRFPLRAVPACHP